METEKLLNQAIITSDGNKLGHIDSLYCDEETDKPTWALVKSGFLGSRLSFVPLGQAKPAEEGIEVPYTKEQITSAPSVEPDGKLNETEEQTLYQHYQIEGDEVADTTGHDTSGKTTDDAMTRSEEELVVDKERHTVGKVRLRKYVVTEDVNVTVPVAHEEVRLEREPITDANVGKAMEGPAISSEEHEVELTEERVVVDKVVVPKERVKLATEKVVENKTVSGEVRKEVIEEDHEDVR